MDFHVTNCKRYLRVCYRNPNASDGGRDQQCDYAGWKVGCTGGC